MGFTSDWYIYFNDEDYYTYSFDILGEDPESITFGKTYTLEDMDAEFSAISFFGMFLVDTYTSASLTITQNEDGLIHAEANISTTEFGDFHIVYDQPEPPTPTDTVDFVSTSLKISTTYLESDGILELTAYNTEGEEFAIDIYAHEDLSGNYTTEDLDYGYIGDVEIYSIDINVNAVENIVTGEILAWNDTLYNLNLTYVKPEKTRSLELNAEGGEFDDMITTDGMWAALFENEKFELQLIMLADEIAGDYTIADNYGDGYSFFAEVNGQDTIWNDVIDADIHVAVNLEDSLVTITGTLLGQNYDDRTDIPELTVKLVMPLVVIEGEGLYEYDEEVDPFNVNFAASEVEIDEQWFADYGDIMVYGENAAGEKIILDIYDYGYADGVFTPGTYNIDLSYADGTVAAGFYEDGYLIPSIAGTVDAQGYFDKVWYLIGGVVTISEDAIVVDAINSNALSIKSTISLAGTAVENIEAGEQSINKTLRNGQVLIQKNNKVYTVLGQEVK